MGISAQSTFGSITSAGKPPANDITSGRWAAARISRIKELLRRETRSEKAIEVTVARHAENESNCLTEITAA
jgi:hypothetical protein